MKFNENHSKDSGDMKQTGNLKVKSMTLNSDLESA